MGQFHHFLGIEVIRQSTGLHRTQTKCIEDLLTKTRMIGATPIAISCFTSFQLSQYDGTLLENATIYRSTVGALQYLTISRPEIAFVVSKVNQFIHKSTDLHWKASKRLLRYLKGTMHYGLFITLASQLDLVAYSDVDWASNPDDRKSTSGCCIYLGSSLVSWGAKKQSVVSHSSTESECRWTCLDLISSYRASGLFCQTPIIWCDNMSAFTLATDPILHAHSKHIEPDFHFLWYKSHWQTSGYTLCS